MITDYDYIQGGMSHYVVILQMAATDQMLDILTNTSFYLITTSVIKC